MLQWVVSTQLGTNSYFVNEVLKPNTPCGANAFMSGPPKDPCTGLPCSCVPSSNGTLIPNVVGECDAMCLVLSCRHDGGTGLMVLTQQACCLQRPFNICSLCQVHQYACCTVAVQCSAVLCQHSVCLLLCNFLCTSAALYPSLIWFTHIVLAADGRCPASTLAKW